jgi:glutamine amidotransferase-like uncharacterized protein
MRTSPAAFLLIAISLAGCTPPPPSRGILLFAGSGTSPDDVAAIQSILEDNHLDYSTASSWQLNRMTQAQIRAHRLLIIPGGNFVTIGNNLSAGAVANIRNSVSGGLNYLGICAGAFFAGNSPYNGLNLTSGVRFGFYAAENQGIRKAPVAISWSAGPTLDQYWEDGPQLTGWGAVVARYPDRTPAVVEGQFGGGTVILAGIHPEAPERWQRGMLFHTPPHVNRSYAATLIRAALNQTPLPHD